MARNHRSTNHIRADSLEVGHTSDSHPKRKIAGWLVRGSLVAVVIFGGARACDDITDNTTNGQPENSGTGSAAGLEPIAGCRVKLGKLGVYATLENLDFPRGSKLKGTVHVHDDPKLPEQWEIFTPDGTPPDGKAYGGDIDNHEFPKGTYIEAGAPRNYLTPDVCQGAGGRMITVAQHYNS